MPVIALVGNKGGAGKTTLSINLASYLARRFSTVVVDADPQGSALQWSVFADSEKAVAVHDGSNDLETQARELLRDNEYVLFDCPPSVHAPQTLKVLEFCDIALIPVQPSPVDLWATVHIEEAVARTKEVNAKLRAILVINQLEVRTTLSQLVRDALTEIGLPIANTTLRRRAIFRNSVLEGKSVFDMGSRGSDAAREIEQLIEEVID